MIRFFSLLIFVTLSTIWGCDAFVTTPGVDKDRQGAVVDHSGFKDGDCNRCHNKDRPPEANGLTHGNNKDCGSCHIYDKAKGWLSLGEYDHGQAKSCGQCHQPKRPTEGHIKTNDCIECHKYNDWKDTASFDHDPQPQECILCHKNKQPAEDHYDGKDCMGCHYYSNWGNSSSYNHSEGETACSQCHTDDKPGGDHPDNNACESCHTFPFWKNITTSSGGGGGEGYEHPAGLNECAEACHARPTTPGSRAYPNQGPPGDYNETDTSYNGSGHYIGKNCASCHLSPGDNKNDWKYDHSKPDADFCLPCHYNQGETKHGTTGTTYEFNDFGNCVNCHKNFNKNQTRNWSL